MEINSPEKKKLTVITGTFHPDVGGPPTYLMNLLSDIAKRDLAAVTVITFGRNTVHYPFRVIRISKSWPILVKLLLFSVKCLLYGRDADVWYVNDYGLPAILANFILRKKIVLKIAGDFAWEYSIRNGYICSMSIDEFQNDQSSKMVNFIKALQRFYVSRVDYIITPSHYLKDIVAGWGIDSKKIEVVFNAINQEKYRSDLSKKEARKFFGLPPEGCLLLTVARLVPWKGIDQIMEKITRLNDSYSYAIAGDGPDMNRLNKIALDLKIENRIFFLGMVDHLQIPHLLRAADVLVLNSQYEGFPHIILEAASVGIPCLVGNQKGSKEAVDMTGSGFVMSTDFPKDIEKAVNLKQIQLSKEVQWDHLFTRMVKILNL